MASGGDTGWELVPRALPFLALPASPSFLWSLTQWTPPGQIGRKTPKPSLSWTWEGTKQASTFPKGTAGWVEKGCTGSGEMRWLRRWRSQALGDLGGSGGTELGMVVFPELAASLQAVLYLLSPLSNIYEAPAAWVQIADRWGSL